MGTRQTMMRVKNRFMCQITYRIAKGPRSGSLGLLGFLGRGLLSLVRREVAQDARFQHLQSGVVVYLDGYLILLVADGNDGAVDPRRGEDAIILLEAADQTIAIL